MARRPMITTEARTSTTAEHERSLLSEMLPDTQRFSARAVRYSDYQPLVGSDASLSTSIASNNSRASRGGKRNSNNVRVSQSYEYAQQPSLLSGILPDPRRFSAYDVRNNNNNPAVVGSDASMSRSMKSGRGEYNGGGVDTMQQPFGPGGGQQQTSFLSEMLPDNQRLSASAIRYDEPPVVGSDASLSAVKSSRGYQGQDDPLQSFVSAQQTSMLSGYLPDTQRSSAVMTKYHTPPTIIGSDASLSTTRSGGQNGKEDSYYGQDSQPFGFAQQTSVLSEMLPDTQRYSAEAIRYNEPPVVGSDASLSPSTPRGYSSGTERNFETIGPKTSPMLDWFSASTSNPGVSFVANDYDNGNRLSALAGSFQVSRPSSRAYNDGSIIGGFSPTNGIGGSNAMGGGEMGTGRSFDYGAGDQGPTSDYYSRPTVESIRDAGVKVQPSSVLGSIASTASRRRMKEIERYVYQEGNASFPNANNFAPQQGSMNYGNNDYYDPYQSGDQTSYAP